MKNRSPRFVFGLLAVVLALTIGLWIGCGEQYQPPSGPEQNQEKIVLSKANPQVRAVMQVQGRYTEDLMAIPGVMGTGTGLTPDGQLVVKVFTIEAGISGIPAHVDGVPVAVEVTGRFVALTDPTARQPRPVPTGVSTGHPDITAGTIGCRVKRDNGTAVTVFALSNNHVYANQNDAQIGDAVIQPGTFDGGSSPADDIGTLNDFEPIDFSGGDNTMDAAIAISTTDLLGNATPSDDGIGTPNSAIFGDSDGDGFFDNIGALLNLDVKKYGRTTKVTHGTITAINATVTVCYDARGRACFKSARFVDQIVITPGGFSSGGDSGSLIVTEDPNNNPVGLLFAGSSTTTIANRIDLVLARFNVTVDDTPPPPEAPLTDVSVTSVSAPASVMQGDVVSVDVTVQNVGNQDVGSFDVTLKDLTDNVKIGTETVASLAAGAATTLTYSWTVPADATVGEHTLEGRHNLVDDDNTNDFATTTVTVNEPTAGVTVMSINPNTMQAGTTVDVTIIGSGFATGADVTFENASGPTPTASNVVVVDANTITATVTVKSGGPPRNRVWDVRVTNPDGSSGVLMDGFGFTVTP